MSFGVSTIPARACRDPRTSAMGCGVFVLEALLNTPGFPES